MRWLEINKNNSMKGDILVPGSKNSSLGLIAACCLSNEKIKLNNIPKIQDINTIKSICSDIGMNIDSNSDLNCLKIDPSNIISSEIDPKLASLYRASYYYVGALLAKFKKVKIGYPGGDNFGSRPIDQHLKGLKALGAKFTFYNDYYVVEADKLIGNNIYFDTITSGATINVILAAVLAEGKTIIKNAAKDPEVVDIAVFLDEMGAKIKGAGTDTITIEGVRELKGCCHTAIPDRLVAGTFLMAAGITGGKVTVNNVIPEHLTTCTAKLEESGIEIEIGNDYITANAPLKLHGVNVKTSMYPGFATDYQQPLTSMLINADTHSTIIETIYPDRFRHCEQLNRMGADIIIRDGNIVIPGNRNLNGTWVHACDIRAGISLMLAGLTAKGTTYITGIEHIERGYCDIVEQFISLGADITLKYDNSISIDKNNLEAYQ